MCRIQPRLFSAPEIFIADAYATKNRHQKMESIYGDGFWSICHGYKERQLAVTTQMAIINSVIQQV